MNIAHLNKAEVLVALYNGSKQQGMGFMDFSGRQPMFFKEAKELLKQTTYFDYLRGRVMKIDLSGDELDTRLYNRDNGPDAAERILATLRSQADMNIETFKIKITWLRTSVSHGWGCGYIGVPKNHPWWGLGYDDVPCSCHGGLTFGRNKHPSPEIPEGTPTDIWWFGFDCAHSSDTQETCPESYVDSEIESLKQQALAVLTANETGLLDTQT